MGKKYEVGLDFRCIHYGGCRERALPDMLRCAEHATSNSETVQLAEEFAVALILRDRGRGHPWRRKRTLRWFSAVLDSLEAWDYVSWFERDPLWMKPGYYDVRRFPLYLHEVVNEVLGAAAHTP